MAYTAKIRYNSNAFYNPNENISDLESIYYDGNDVVMELRGEVDLLTHQEKELTSFALLTMLYKDKSLPIIIEEFEWEDGVLGVEKIDGTVKTKPVCVENIRFTEPYELSVSASPNPVNDVSVVSIHPASDCNGEIVLYNSQGKQILKKNISLFDDKISDIEIDLSDLSNGVYFYMIRFTGNIYTLPIIKTE